MNDLVDVINEVQTRIRIAERQGWTNRSVPVRLLRQIAKELLSANVSASTRSDLVVAEGVTAGETAPLNIPVTAFEREWIEHAASLRSLTLVEYVRRAINLSLRKEGVDALLLAQSDDASYE